MTKARRVILLVVDIVTVLSGVVALFVGILFAALRSDFSPRTPSHQEIYAASVTMLRSDLKLAVDDISFLSGTVHDWGRLILFFGVIMFIGSVLRLALTPWRLYAANNRRPD
jgi:hypothetical protein